jgi:hypothetical protein
MKGRDRNPVSKTANGKRKSLDHRAEFDSRQGFVQTGCKENLLFCPIVICYFSRE